MMFDYSYLLERYKKIETSGTFVPITGGVLTIAVVIYGIRTVFRNGLGGNNDTKRYRMIPTPSGSVFYFGHKLLMGDMPARKITEWHKELGPILKVKMGAEDWVFISQADMAHDIFTWEENLTSKSPHFMSGDAVNGGTEGLHTFDGDDAKWKDVRSAMLHFLSPSSIRGFDLLLQEEAQKTVDQLIRKSQEHGSVDALSFIRLNAINVILATSFGQLGTRSLYDPLYRCLRNRNGTNLQGASIWKPWYWITYLRGMFGGDYKPKNALYAPLQRVIQRARKSDLDNMVKRIDLLKEEYEIDEHAVTTIMGELLVAGMDTLSSATAWTLAILCHYPDVQRLLAQEIDNFIKKHYRIPAFDDLCELPYYNAVQKECLRFRPPVYWSIPRKASQDVVYRNYLIPKGSTIIGNIHVLNNDEYAFTQPEKFLPERFLHDSYSMHTSANGGLGERDHYAFGWGKRICPGISLAENEMFNIVTRLMARCTIEPATASNGQVVYPNLYNVRNAGTAVMPGPFKLRFVERDNRLIV
ncbi:hypothetical protein PS15p_209253 [Mucor circinelloides]